MKLSNQEIVSILNALGDIQDKEMPILLTYQFVDNIDRLYKAYNPYNTAREKAKTQEDLLTLLSQTRDVDIIKIKKQDLIDAGIDITPAQLMAIRVILDG